MNELSIGLLKASFSLLANSESEFPINFDSAWRWIGYSSKDNAKRSLELNFSQGIDYNSFSESSGKLGGRPSVQFMLTVDCFKTFCMLANTEQGKNVRKYYIEVEKELIERKKERALRLPDFSNPAVAARAWAIQYEQREMAESKLLEAQPKVDFVNSLSPCKGSQGIGQFAKSVNSGQNRMFAWLREKKYIIPGKTVPFQRWIDQGLFEVTQGIKNERVWAVSQITPKGIARIGEEFVQSQKK